MVRRAVPLQQQKLLIPTTKLSVISKDFFGNVRQLNICNIMTVCIFSLIYVRKSVKTYRIFFFHFIVVCLIAFTLASRINRTARCAKMKDVGQLGWSAIRFSGVFFRQTNAIRPARYGLYGSG